MKNGKIGKNEEIWPLKKNRRFKGHTKKRTTIEINWKYKVKRRKKLNTHTHKDYFYYFYYMYLRRRIWWEE
jgi:hypothetical protein